MNYLNLVFTILVIFLAYRRLQWALMLILFCLPIYQLRFSFFGLPMTLLEVMILSCFTVWFITQTKFISFLKRQYGWKDYLSAKSKRGVYPFRHEIALVLIISYFAVGVAWFSNASLGVWKAYFFEPILIFILVLNIFREEDREGHSSFNFEKIILPLITSAFFVSAFAIFQKVTGVMTVENFLPRVTGVYTYPNALGLFLAPIALLASGMIISGINNKKFNLKFNFYIITIVLSVAACILASSEGALVGILAAWFIIGGLFIADKIKNKLFKNTSEFLILACFIFTLLSPWFFLKVVPEYKFFNFSSGTLNYLSDKIMLKDFSGEVRKQQWRETWKMMTASPKTFIFGAGLSNYQTSVKPYHQEGIFFNQERDVDFRQKIVWYDAEYKAKHWRPVEIYMYPHNIFLNFWTELGLAGMVLFALLIGKFLYIGIKLYENESANKGLVLGLIGAMIAIFIHGLVDVPYLKNDLAVIFWVLVAMMGAVKIKNKA